MRLVMSKHQDNFCNYQFWTQKTTISNTTSHDWKFENMSANIKNAVPLLKYNVCVPLIDSPNLLTSAEE